MENVVGGRALTCPGGAGAARASGVRIAAVPAEAPAAGGQGPTAVSGRPGVSTGPENALRSGKNREDGTMRPQTVYKIVDRESWEAATAEGVYRGAPVDLADGFIHLSARGQVMETARKHFRGMRGLLLVAIRSDSLGDALKWEKSRGNELFPHLYADLPTGAAVWVKPLPLSPAGHIFPELDA
ncbi:uncharacterized protein (DUF952 family) [Amorphus suaedae]